MTLLLQGPIALRMVKRAVDKGIEVRGTFIWFCHIVNETSLVYNIHESLLKVSINQ